MLILIDGYNVIAPVAPPRRGAPADWLRAERQRLIDRLADGLDEELARQTCVVFDAATPPHGPPSRLRVRAIDVRFAVDHREADDLIEELIAAHHSPRRLTVVSSDRRLQVAAKRAGAVPFDSQLWLDALLEKRLLLAIRWPPRNRPASSDPTAEARVEEDDSLKHSPLDRQAIVGWLAEFGLSDTEIAAVDVAARQEEIKPPANPPTRKLAENRDVPSPPPPRDRQSDRKRDRDAGKRSGRNRERGTERRELPETFNPFPEGYGEDLLP